jgi:hypothetical protein
MGILTQVLDQIRSLVPARRSTRRQRPASRLISLTCDPLEARLLLDGTGMMNPVLQGQMMDVMNLVPDSAVTDMAVTNGGWNDARTWSHGVPTLNDNVLIPTNVTVTVASVQTEALRTIRVDGTLRFATNVNTTLTVDTMVVMNSGSLIMGTAAQPVAPNVRAKIVIADRGPIDTNWDPSQFSRGIISTGTVTIYGAQTTSYETLAQQPTAGTTQLVLSSVPVNWKVGDRLVITGTDPSANEDEERAILGISGNVVTVSPLAFDHVAPQSGLSIYVANVSRNVDVVSQNPAQIDRRGHVMFMSAMADINYAGFYGLGRTDKSIPLNDPQYDANGQLIPGTGTNPRGRYAVHFHMTGTDPGSMQAEIRGSAVVDSPGWGFVNHSSNVDMEDNVAFNVLGAAFVTEAGDEIGAFRGNLAIRSTGSGAGLEDRQDQQDFGHNGVGFWFQGPGVEVQNNIAVGQAEAGFVYYTLGLVQNGLGETMFNNGNLKDPSLAMGSDGTEVGIVPIRLFEGNQVYASADGLEIWYHLWDAPDNRISLVKDLTAWNISNVGIFFGFTQQVTFQNVRLLGSPSALYTGSGVDNSYYSGNIVFNNFDVEGFLVGINMPGDDTPKGLGVDVVQGGYFNNLTNFTISPPVVDDHVGSQRSITINGVSFGPLAQYNIFLQSNFDLTSHDLPFIFDPDLTVPSTVGTVLFNGKQLYFPEQAPDFVPFPVGQSPSWIPSELVGKTNAQIWDQYGLGIGGMGAPSGLTTDASINALLGAPRAYLPYLRLESARYTNQLTGYQLMYRDATGEVIVDPTLVNLHEGWNLVTRTIDGMTRTFLVYGDTTPPTFEADPSQLVINPADLKTGLVFVGQLVDESFGSLPIVVGFSDLDQLPLQTRADGSKYVVVEFTIQDLAGNTSDIKLQITVDPNAPRQPTPIIPPLMPRFTQSVTLESLLG